MGDTAVAEPVVASGRPTMPDEAAYNKALAKAEAEYQSAMTDLVRWPP